LTAGGGSEGERREGGRVDHGAHVESRLHVDPRLDVESRSDVDSRSHVDPPWRIERQRGSARHLLDSSLTLVGAEGGGGRQLRVLQVDRPAVVIGSGQPLTDVDMDAARDAGVEVVRRRSGGGAVLLDPDGVIWVDAIIPSGDPLWDADIRRATWWIGDAWAAAIEKVGAGPAQVWRGGMRATAWSGVVCFGGLGPGEVCRGPQKVVGVAQRRTRSAALFQTAALLSWDPARLLGLLRVDAAARDQGAVDLLPLAVGVGPERAEALVEALVEGLTASPD
jgi:lipoate-protein ligase A